MWIAPVLVVAAIVGHVGRPSGQWTAGQVAMMALAGVCIGLAEELATRGIAVKMLRDAAHSERFVALVSSLLFALMHTVNLIPGWRWARWPPRSGTRSASACACTSRCG